MGITVTLVNVVAFHISLAPDSVELTKGFPVEAPIITVRSVYHKLDSLPCESQMKHYHFNSQWSAEEMVERTK